MRFGAKKVEWTDDLCARAQIVGGFQEALRLLGGKWKIEIMWCLVPGKKRFGELMRQLPGITQHMLTTQLRDLEAHGLVSRTVFAEVPPRVEYALTPAAEDLGLVFEAILLWADLHAETLKLAACDGEGRAAAEG